ncbi:hypothetical protein Ciccas_009392 [Cichlidogyrus casuarinus]|uniref:Uncharacterized protein n=1 Tax=Cichlidogyrus casuarinus TaxID=1844966 RepID=A0ABD2PX66_9PLAT
MTDDRIKFFSISSSDGKAEARISSYGAALIVLKLPPTQNEATNEPVDVVLGYEDLASYQVASSFCS